MYAGIKECAIQSVDCVLWPASSCPAGPTEFMLADHGTREVGDLGLDSLWGDIQSSREASAGIELVQESSPSWATFGESDGTNEIGRLQPGEHL
jgi:hypothetical protein